MMLFALVLVLVLTPDQAAAASKVQMYAKDNNLIIKTLADGKFLVDGKSVTAIFKKVDSLKATIATLKAGTTTVTSTTATSTTATAIECTRPAIATGYAIDAEVLDVPNFAVTFTGGACAAGYTGTPSAAACSFAGEYTLSGCTSTPTYTPVMWTGGTFADVSTDGLIVNNGPGGDWNSGAISTQTISSSATAQGVRFKCGHGPQYNANVHGPGFQFGGLSNKAWAANYGHLEFAWHCGGTSTDGILNVYESGQEATTLSGAQSAWDETTELEIRVTGTTVEYLKNNEVLFTSSATPTFPLHVDVVMMAVNANMNTVEILLTT